MTRVVPPNVERLLTGERVVAHLATCRDGRPHVAPVWYLYEDDRLEILTTGVKLANVRANPHVAVSVEHSEDGTPSWMVAVRGTATVVDDGDETRAANRRLNRKYGADEDAWSENVLVRIDVDSVTHRTY
jgi:PPOX class probable F420-dependent enzyme